MATVNAGTLRYSINGDRWREPYNSQIMIGYSSGNTYRAYFTLDLTSYSVVSSVDSASLTITDTTDYGSSGSVYIGLRTSEPPLGFSTSDYTTNLGTFTITRQQSNTLTLTASNLKAYMGKTVYVCILAASGQYFEFGAGSSNKPSFSFTYTSYTKCGLPTNINFTSVVKPGGTLTISWSAAQGGTSNPVTGYDVYYKVGSAPTTSSYDGSASVSSTSATFTISSSATRTAKFYAIIRTKGSAGSSWYSDWASSNGGVVNSLPSVPTVLVTSSSVYYGQSVTFTTTPGTDPNGQTRSVYYATSANGTKNLVNNNSLTVTINSTTTYYFWTYDTQEYSASYTSKTITKSNPVISINNGTTINSVTALNTTAENNFNGFANSITPKVDVSSSGTVYWSVELRTLNNTTDSFTKQYEYPSTANSKTATAAGTITLDPTNIDMAVKNTYTVGTTKFYAWRIKYSFKDTGGTITSDFYYPASGHFYAVPGASSGQGFYNQFANSNISGTTTGHIGKLVRFKLWNDTSTTTVSASVKSVKIGSAIYDIPTNTTGTSIDGNYRNVDITLATAPKSGATVTFEIICSNSNVSKITTVTATECLHPDSPTIGGFDFGATIIKPFSANNDTFPIVANWPFGSETDISDALTAYECESDAIKLVFSRNNNTEVRSGLTYSKNTNDQITTTMQQNAVYNWGTLGLNPSTYRGEIECKVKLYFKNRYNMEFSTSEQSYTLVFNEFAINPQITSASCALSSTGDWYIFNLGDSSAASSSSPNALQEGLYLKFTATCSAYTADAMTFNIYKDDSLYAHTTVAAASRASNQSAVGVTAYIVTPIAEEVASSSNIRWKLSVVNNAGTSTIQNNDRYSAAIRHTSPSNFELNTCTITSVGTDSVAVNFTATCSDSGAAAPSYWLYDGASDVTNTSLTITFGGASNSASINSANWESKPIAIHMQSVTSQELTSGVSLINTKNFYTNYIPIYQLMPTVAYRKNALGINTKTLTSDAILDIHTAQNADSIFFNGAGPNTSTVAWGIDVPEGEISYSRIYTDSTPSINRVLDLANGTITGPFTVDGDLNVSKSAWIGTLDDTSQEYQLHVQGGAGDFYLFSATSSTGYRGIYTGAHGSGAAKYVLQIDSDNNVSLNGNAATATTATTATAANALNVIDRRASAMTIDYNKKIEGFFSNNGMPDSKWWAGLHISGWTGGYSSWEIVGPAHNADQRTQALYIRSSNINSAWGSWRKVYDSSNLPTLSELGAAASSHNHAAGDINSGTLGIARGGTGRSTLTSNAVLTGNGTSAVNMVATASGALYATAANGAAKFGTLPVAQGGTGLTSSPSMLTNLGSTTAANVLAASPRPGITGTLGIGNGGTGKTTAADARSNLGAAGRGAAKAAAVSAATNYTGLTLSEGEFAFLGYKTSYTTNGDITLKVNGSDAVAGSYWYEGSFSNSKIFARSGGTAGTFAGFIACHDGVVEVWGMGRRGSNSAYTAYSALTFSASSVTSIQFSRAGQVTWYKLTA